jgi:thiol-disulfide isomerase/thioredoxin
MSLYRLVLIISIIQTNILVGQIIRINLDSLTTKDDTDFSIHILKSQPSKPVKLPPGDNQSRRFLTEFYSWKMTDDPDIVVMIESKKNGDLLYIDRNMNNDLTDDGLPLSFPFKQDTISFDIIAPKDAQQRTKILFSRANTYKSRVIDLPDTIRKNNLDQFNNLNPKLAKVLGGFYGEPDFKGSAGSFYFADRVSVRRGSIVVNKTKYSIGLFDFSNNGLFNDDDDLLLIDNGESGALRFDDKNRVFKLDDIFTLGNQNFKIDRIDPYGKWIEVEKTLDENTLYYKKYNDSLTISAIQKVKLKQELWDNKFISLDGDSISLNSFKGKYILLNFWGEWCPPCLEEIPFLVGAMKEYPETRIQFISFIKLQDEEKAKMVIKENGINWPQIKLTDKIEKKFMIRGLPTNILILPNGDECLILHQVNKLYFKQNIK